MKRQHADICSLCKKPFEGNQRRIPIMGGPAHEDCSAKQQAAMQEDFDIRNPKPIEEDKQ